VQASASAEGQGSFWKLTAIRLTVTLSLRSISRLDLVWALFRAIIHTAEGDWHTGDLARARAVESAFHMGSIS
jgi:hypothetical protein